MQLIQTQTISSQINFIQFVSIPQRFTDLVVVASLRTNEASSYFSSIRLSLNDNLTDGTLQFVQGNGSTVSTLTNTQGLAFRAPATVSDANSFGSTFIQIPNYTSQQSKKARIDSILENNVTSANQTFQQLAHYGIGITDPITSLALSATASALVIGSTISLYGIKNGSDGIVTTS